MSEINQQLFEEKIRRTPTCWLWTAGISYDGYGKFAVQRTPEGAHRVAYMLWRGDIPDDKVIVHTCKNKLCVNPEHLQAVTVKVSVNRSKRAERLNRTHCPRGHEMTPDNIYEHPRNNGSGRASYECLTCRREKDRELYHRKKLSAL